jgi:hypothetical protein
MVVDEEPSIGVTMTATTTPDTLSNVHLPAGATSVDEWDTASDPVGRYFTGKKWPLSRRDAEVLIDGFQRPNGSEERRITMIDNGRECLCDLTADVAREIGLALIAAADDIDIANA